MIKKNLLITGASGYLGQHLISQFEHSRKIIGLYCKTPIPNTSIIKEKRDLLKSADFESIFDKHNISEVIHCAAIANPDLCFQYPKESHIINVSTTILIAQICYKNNIPFVHISTDGIFDGDYPPYSEESEVYPVNLYGKQKYESEQKVLNENPNAIICRVPRMFSFDRKDSFFLTLFNRLSRRMSVELFSDMFRTFISGHVAARGIEWSLENARGIIHIGGKDKLSFFEFGKHIAEIYSFDSSKIKKTSMIKHNYIEYRPKDVSLDSSRAFSMGFECPKIKEQITEAIISNRMNN